MSRYRIEHRLAGWVVGLGWVLVMFALVGLLMALVLSVANGRLEPIGPVIEMLSAGLPMVLVGSACRAVFEVADAVLPRESPEAERVAASPGEPEKAP